ncbi:MAG: GNAT family N-acetyltransferase [Jatrophihabitantaceae bacterium]
MSTSGELAKRSLGVAADAPVEVSFEPRPYDDPDVVRLVADVQAEYVIRYGGPDEAAVDLAEFAPPNGLFLVGLLRREPVVTGGWRLLDGQQATAEIKRMYVVPAARGRGFARQMLTELEASAAAHGAHRIVLNTGTKQPEAIALYESSGYDAIGGFGHYACTPGALFYAKRLT